MEIVGTVIDRKYRVLRQIGSGGMGKVYEAVHVLIGRRVALKMLHPEYATQTELVDRFHREAQAASRIGHVNIVEVTDMGTSEAGAPYLVMEYLDGEPVSAVLAREPKLEVARTADIVGQGLAALGAAHAKGIVHRDFKPENAFLINLGGRADFVKVLDFGIARIHTLGTARLTATGTTLGTPYYMAPEQAEGRTDIDHRVDIYAAGVVLYEALAGRTPYVGSNYNALLAQVLREEPPPIETFRPGLDPAVIRVVRTAMQRKPEDRFASAEAMIEALLPFGAARTPFERPSRGPSEMPDAGRAQAMLPTLATGSAAPPPAAASAATVIPAAAPAAASRVPSISPVGQAAVTGEGGDVPPPRLRSRQLLAFAAVLAVALGAGAFLLLSGGDDRPTERTGTGPSSGSQAQPDGTFFAPPLPPSPHVVPTALPTGKAVVLPAEGAAAGAQSPDAVFDSVDARMLPVLPADDGGRISASRTDAGRRPARDAGTDSPGSTISGPSGTKVRTSYE